MDTHFPGRGIGLATARLGLGLVITAGLCAQDSRPARPHRLAAFFWHDSPNDLAALAGIRKGLATAGLPHQIEVLQANADAARGRALLEPLCSSGCELVFAMGTQATLLARDGLELPIVYTAVTNPVASGVVPSWGASGRALAGNSNWIPPQTVLHVFRYAVPDLARLGMLRSKTSGVVSAAELAAMRDHLATDGAPAVTIVEQIVDDEGGIETAVGTLLAERVQAIWIPIDFTIYQNMPRVRAALGASSVPLVSSSLQGSHNGAVVGVLVDYEMLGQRAAAIAVDVLRGRRRPDAIPVDTMRGYQVVVNLAVARRTGYEVPLSLLALADLLIDDDNEAADGRR